MQGTGHRKNSNAMPKLQPKDSDILVLCSQRMTASKGSMVWGVGGLG